MVTSQFGPIANGLIRAGLPVSQKRLRRMFSVRRRQGTEQVGCAVKAGRGRMAGDEDGRGPRWILRTCPEDAGAPTRGSQSPPQASRCLSQKMNIYDTGSPLQLCLCYSVAHGPFSLQLCPSWEKGDECIRGVSICHSQGESPPSRSRWARRHRLRHPPVPTLPGTQAAPGSWRPNRSPMLHFTVSGPSEGGDSHVLRCGLMGIP